MPYSLLISFAVLPCSFNSNICRLNSFVYRFRFITIIPVLLYNLLYFYPYSLSQILYQIQKEIVKPMCEKMGMPYDAMGIVFKNSAEKTLYVAGDTIWCEEVKQTLDTYKPQVVLINACGASLLIGNGERLIMHKQDVDELASYIPQAQIIASHMDTVSHLTVTRQDIRSLGLPNVHVPEDNEVLSF